MTRDFTRRAYSRLIGVVAARYTTVPFRSFVTASGDDRVACIRHDIDRRASAAIHCAIECRSHDVTATFYFRYPYTFDAEVLRRVAELEHEVGYHYETVTKTKGDLLAAKTLFGEELREFRRVVRVETACMHGSPLSQWDNRDIWSSTTLTDHGLVGEPYLSLTPDVGYLTDTGRGWNRRSASIRDSMPGPMPAFPSTFALIAAIDAGALPRRLMINIHPERWNDAVVPWTVELVGQTAKNQVKSVLRHARRARSAKVS